MNTPSLVPSSLPREQYVLYELLYMVVSPTSLMLALSSTCFTGEVEVEPFGVELVELAPDLIDSWQHRRIYHGDDSMLSNLHIPSNEVNSASSLVELQ